MRTRYENQDELTPRERDVVSLLIQGLSNEEIANALRISRKAVERYITNILEKLGLENRTQIVMHMVATGQVLIL